MNQDNTKKLLKRFPHLYWQYYMPMSMTCMCWGFECGNGWFKLIWDLSVDIDKELNYSWATKMKFRLAIWYWNISWGVKQFLYSSDCFLDKETGETKTRILPWYKKLGNALLEKVPKMHIKHYKYATTQVKEKYADLSYYYTSVENEVIEKRIALAEEMSATICEECGEPGEIRGEHWYVCRCDDCNDKKIGTVV